jgi:hypothetical protein
MIHSIVQGRSKLSVVPQGCHRVRQEGLSPPESLHQISSSRNSFQPERADSGRDEKELIVNKTVPTCVLPAHPGRVRGGIDH